MNLEATRIEAERELTRVKVHIDMDAFFASVEMRDDPTLRSIPMGVGTDLMLVSSYHGCSRGRSNVESLNFVVFN